VTVVIPANVTRSRLRILSAYGASVVTTDAQEGMDGAIDAVRALVAGDPGRYFYPDQYNNPANWRAHFYGTGTEILSQTAGRVTHFVAGVGTSGTFVGTGRRLRASRPEAVLASFEPDSPLHALEGLKHLPSTAHVPGIYDPGLADRRLTVSTEDARAMALDLEKNAGILVGPSAAAAAVAADRIARNLESGVVVTVFPDSAEKYREEPFWRTGPET
jgi:cysteine synthase B